jgi:hypothetical protein
MNDTTTATMRLALHLLDALENCIEPQLHGSTLAITFANTDDARDAYEAARAALGMDPA